MSQLIKENINVAEVKWNSQLSDNQRQALRFLSRGYGFRVALGDLLLLDGNWYVTHSGLLRLARRTRCRGINVQQVSKFCDSSSAHWVFKATVYKSRCSRGFSGYGDANPSNVSPLVQGAEMRVAETRAVNRALRKAYGIGICSVEEIGSLSTPLRTSREPKTEIKKVPPQPANGNNDNGSRVRDTR